MKSLFEESTIGRMRLRNRFVRSATWEGMAGDDGSVTDGIVDMYDGLSKGGVGLIITGHAYVNKEGQAVERQLGIPQRRKIEYKIKREEKDKDGYKQTYSQLEEKQPYWL